MTNDDDTINTTSKTSQGVSRGMDEELGLPAGKLLDTVMLLDAPGCLVLRDRTSGRGGVAWGGSMLMAGRIARLNGYLLDGVWELEVVPYAPRDDDHMSLGLKLEAGRHMGRLGAEGLDVAFPILVPARVTLGWAKLLTGNILAYVEFRGGMRRALAVFPNVGEYVAWHRREFPTGRYDRLAVPDTGLSLEAEGFEFLEKLENGNY